MLFSKSSQISDSDSIESSILRVTRRDKMHILMFGTIRFWLWYDDNGKQFEADYGYGSDNAIYLQNYNNRNNKNDSGPSRTFIVSDTSWIISVYHHFRHMATKIHKN